MLHIGGARTALFNWLYAKANGGKFLLRIEDTDQQRSTPEATNAIFTGLKWLELNWDEEVQSQIKNQKRHLEIVNQLLAQNKAYKCFCTEDEIQVIRNTSKEKGNAKLFNSPWREITQDQHPDRPFVIRLKTPLSGHTSIEDEVQGKITWKNEVLEDFVLLRSDSCPTYMLAVVVDDHDSNVTHIIRGDDHLSNAAKQKLIYQAMDWRIPIFAHIPLIFGEDGKKLSKRHGATGTTEYQKLGYTPAGMRNYLARLGWSHGDDEFFNTTQAISWFDLKGINKSPARFDFKKLDSINGKHIATLEENDLIKNIEEFTKLNDDYDLTKLQISKISKALYCLREKSKKIPDIIDKAHFLLTTRPIVRDDRAKEVLNSGGIQLLKQLTPYLENVSWSREGLEIAINNYLLDNSFKLGQIVQPLKAALSGKPSTPSVFDMMVLLGPDEVKDRINDL
tara:strand:- start:1526 stop:2875 length:1350 start_codon:yes stop_codon:yes gene_type:complete